MAKPPLLRFRPLLFLIGVQNLSGFLVQAKNSKCPCELESFPTPFLGFFSFFAIFFFERRLACDTNNNDGGF